ncbi:MAG: glycoside hydrolase family 9 protein [Pseudomonadota bacterium]
MGLCRKVTPLLLSVYGASAAAQACTVDAPTNSDGAAIVLSQIGWEVSGPMQATLHTRSAEAQPWVLRDASGAEVASGLTVPRAFDDAAGAPGHIISVPQSIEAGDGFTLESCGETSRTFSVSKAPYRTLSEDAVHYFYLNRAGVPLFEEHMRGPAWARNAGHTSEKVTCFSGRDKWGTRWPKCDHTLDVTGGWYDAGDFGKYVVNGGIAVWSLQNAAERLRYRTDERSTAWGDGRLLIPESNNEISDILDEARIGMEFLLSMQVPSGAKVAVARGQQEDGKKLRVKTIDGGGLAHHKVHEKKWLTLPLLPENAREPRFLAPPSTAATLNLAAAAAQCARLWKGIDNGFAERCLTAATSAYEAAKANPEILAYNNLDGGGPYDDKDLSDEFAWAAMELFATTGDRSYVSGLSETPGRTWLQRNGNGSLRDTYWGGVDLLPIITIATLTDVFSEQDRERAKLVLTGVGRRYLAQGEASIYDLPFPADGFNWGSAGAIADRGIVLAAAYDVSGDEAFRNGAVAALDMLLGRNVLDQSFVAGYGERAPRFFHHRFWAAGADPKFPEGPPGAMSGGPNGKPADDKAREVFATGCAPMACWIDDHNSYSMNEVAINWNAALAWLAIYLDTTPPNSIERVED